MVNLLIKMDLLSVEEFVIIIDVIRMYSKIWNDSKIESLKSNGYIVWVLYKMGVYDKESAFKYVKNNRFELYIG